MVVANAGDGVLTPAIGAEVGVFERKVFPSRAVRAVILAHGSPGTLGNIRTPAPPMLLAAGGLDKASFFSVHSTDSNRRGKRKLRLHSCDHGLLRCASRSAR